MKIYLKYDFKVTCEAVLREQLQILNIPFKISATGEIDISDVITKDQKKKLILALEKYGITIVDDIKTSLVERIKHAIDEMLFDEDAKNLKVSTYLADKLNYTYSHLSNIFSESTYSSIENYIILRKVDFAKDLLNDTDLTLTEIAFKLNYSSVAHLSGQFKKMTGLTPSTFRRIMKRKKS
jgi:AraC-like DNA-binding protein